MQTQSTADNVITLYSPRDMLRETILDTLHAWVRQRPGLDPRNYISDWDDHAGRAAYRSDSRAITTHLRDARAMLRYIELRPTITGADLLAALNMGGRLTYTPGRGLDYTTGQYWPTEYRATACRVLSSVIWDYLRRGASATDGDAIRRAARRELGASIARRWFR
jgi:hypothetical protein